MKTKPEKPTHKPNKKANIPYLIKQLRGARNNLAIIERSIRKLKKKDLRIYLHEEFQDFLSTYPKLHSIRFEGRAEDDIGDPCIFFCWVDEISYQKAPDTFTWCPIALDKEITRFLNSLGEVVLCKVFGPCHRIIVSSDGFKVEPVDL